jgi:hypothetical protein
MLQLFPVSLTMAMLVVVQITSGASTMRLKRISVAIVALVAAVVAISTTSPADAASGSKPVRGTLWSGYITRITLNGKHQPTSTDYFVDAEWTVPSLNCNPFKHPVVGWFSVSAMWIGLGGVGDKKDPASGNLVQVGIESKCVDYTQQHRAVYQVLPPDKTDVGLPCPKGKNCTVAAGDQIVATVVYLRGFGSRSPYKYALVLSDSAADGVFKWEVRDDVKVSFSNIPDSADWIVEYPAICKVVLHKTVCASNFADFGTVEFRDPNYWACETPCTSNPPPAQANTAQFIATGPSTGKNLDKVGALSGPKSKDPGAFTVTWLHAN